jgi:hypothetical protein
MHRGWGYAVAVVMAAWLIAGTGVGGQFASAAPSTKSPELESAIAELKREYAVYAKDPEREKLRAEASYFKKGTATIPPDAVFAALEKPIPGVPVGDVRQAAYVRWQLLSALPETLEDAHVRRLLKLYDRAPLPAIRYGASKQEQKELDRLIPNARREDDVKLTSAMDEQAAKAAMRDRPVTGLREELYRRLPLGRDKLVAGMTDVGVRLSVASDTKSLAELLAEDLTKWSTGLDVDRAELREVVELFGKLRMTESPPYYAYASVRSGKLGWRTRTDSLLTRAKATALHKQLLEAAAASEKRPAPPPAAAGANTRKNGSKEPPTKKAGTSS